MFVPEFPSFDGGKNLLISMVSLGMFVLFCENPKKLITAGSHVCIGNKGGKPLEEERENLHLGKSLRLKSVGN